MDITEIQDELLRLEYPTLLPDHDPDIERYYYLRSTGQAQDALGIYQNRLRPRYPDDEFRTVLLRAYRSHDPSFRALLARGYRMLGARSLERIKRVIIYFANKAESFNEKDVYSTIKAAEDILQFLPAEKYEAVAAIERYHRYADALGLHEKSMAKASDLVRAYLTDTLSVVEEERRRRSEAARNAEEAERARLVKMDWDSYLYQKQHGYRGPLIDLSSVVFSEADLARIEIPPFRRIEDQVLGYCIKYWNQINDPAFERILFLYSRKYGRKNHDVYTAIRRGRMAKHRDDEILASVMSVLVTGYYYSVQGDIYLQRNWNAIKYALNNPQLAAAKPKAIAAPAPAKKSAKALPAAKRKTATKALPAPPTQKVAAKKTEAKKVEGKKTAAQKPLKVKAKKAKIVEKAVKRKAAAPQPVPKIAPVKKPQTAIAPPMAAKPVSKKAVVAKPKVQPAVAVQKTEVKVPAKLKPAPEQQTTIVAKPAPQKTAAVPQTKPAPQKSAPTQKPEPKKIAPPAPRPAPYITMSPPPPPRKQRTFNTTLEKAGGSVSDRLKQLSGRSYDVYQDRFLSKARVAIRKVLGSGRGLFFNLPEEAEDLVFGFLRDHYSDPYMNWEKSSEKKQLLDMGYDLPSINDVIDECYKSL